MRAVVAAWGVAREKQICNRDCPVKLAISARLREKCPLQLGDSDFTSILVRDSVERESHWCEAMESKWAQEAGMVPWLVSLTPPTRFWELSRLLSCHRLRDDPAVMKEIMQEPRLATFVAAMSGEVAFIKDVAKLYFNNYSY